MSASYSLLGDGTGSGVYSPPTSDKDNNYFQMKPLPGRTGDRSDGITVVTGGDDALGNCRKCDWLWITP
ncbi:MAG: hypothetical protein M1813_007126, partial [Trichoglossum hirsutum]